MGVLAPSTVVEVVIIACVFVGLPLLCWLDPAGHYAAEVKRRSMNQAENQG